ncbi:MAG: RbsD/FucU domain-containing protein [Sedimentisphaerales bacterium]
MLKNIPAIISPEFMKILMEMGHGDEVVLADGNFPAASIAKRLVRCDGHGVPDILEAVLKFFPLDRYVDYPVALMVVVPGDKAKPTIWEQYREIIKASGEKFSDFEFVERFEFYERAKKTYAVIASSEKSLYANIILKKGVL